MFSFQVWPVILHLRNHLTPPVINIHSGFVFLECWNVFVFSLQPPRHFRASRERRLHFSSLRAGGAVWGGASLPVCLSPCVSSSSIRSARFNTRAGLGCGSLSLLRASPQRLIQSEWTWSENTTHAYLIDKAEDECQASVGRIFHTSMWIVTVNHSRIRFLILTCLPLSSCCFSSSSLLCVCVCVREGNVYRNASQACSPPFALTNTYKVS